MFSKSNLHHAYLIEGDRDSALVDIHTFLLSELGVSVQNNSDYWQGHFETFGIDDARSLKERASLKAQGKKFFVISFNFITSEAQNSLLKVFEDPTEGTHFFIITPSVEYLLPTLMSRLSVVAGESTESKKGAGEAFLKATKAERLKIVKDMIEAVADEEKSKAEVIAFVRSVERSLYDRFQNTKEGETKKQQVGVLQKITDLETYLYDRGSSLKLLLEYVALLV